MERVKRAIFFWSLVVAFLIIAPVIVLNATGYRFDFNRGVFVYSGAITIKSNPQSINVTLNGKTDDSKKLNRINNSFNLTGLLPDDYDIKVSADGYRTWSKKADVHSGISSEFWNVLLVRNDYKKTSYDDTSGIDRFYISPRNRYIAYTKNTDQGLQVSIYNISSKKTEQTYDFNGWSLIDKDKKENIEWSPQEDYLSVPVERDAPVQNTKNHKASNEPATTREYAYFIVDNGNKTTSNLNDFLENKSIRDVRWDPQEKGYLFFLSENTLYRANIADKNSITAIATDVTCYDLSKNEVYYVQKPNNLVFNSSLDGKSNKVQLTSNFPGGADDTIDKMIVYDDSRVTFIDQNRNLYVYNEGDHDTYFRELGQDVDGVHFSDDGKKLLFWTPNEISTYFLRDWQVQPTRGENDLTNVTRYSEPIDNVQWFKDYEHVIFNTGRWVKIIELDPRDHRNCMDLTNTSIKDPFIRYDNSLEYLFFTDKNGEVNTLQSIVFPEPTPLLGIGG